LVNITVDDADESISYNSSPPGLWKQGNGGCPGCSAQPDPNFMHSGTWHDTTAVPPNFPGLPPTGPISINFTFSGIAISAFCALHNFTNMQFLIDGNMAGQFSRTVDDFQYNVPVFAKGGLSPGQHTFTLLNTPSDSTTLSLVLFDYLVYTQGDPQPQKASNNNPTSQPIQGGSTSRGPGLISTTDSPVSATTTAHSNINSGPLNETNLSSTIAPTFGSVTVTRVQTVSPSSSPTGVPSKPLPTSSAANTNRKSRFNLVKTVAVAVGGTVLLLIFAVGLWIYRLRRRARALRGTNSPHFIQPYNSSAEGLIHPQADEKQRYGTVVDTWKTSHHRPGPSSITPPSSNGRNTGPSSGQLHQRQRTPDARLSRMNSNGIPETVSSASAELVNSSRPSQSDEVRSSPRRPNQRAVDAGRLLIPSGDEDENSAWSELPPDYQEVFTESSSH